MIHLAALLLHAAWFGGCLAWLARFVSDVLRSSELVAVPVVCEEPARSHVEAGELVFVPYSILRAGIVVAHRGVQ